MVYRWHVYLWCIPGKMEGWDGCDHGRNHAKFTQVRDDHKEGHWAIWAVVHAEDYRNACTQTKLWAAWFGYCLDDVKVGCKANIPPGFLDDRDPWAIE